MFGVPQRVYYFFIAFQIINATATTTTFQPLFGQYRSNGKHNGNSFVLGPGKKDAPVKTKSFIGGNGGRVGQPVITSDGTIIYIDAGGTVRAVILDDTSSLWMYSTNIPPFSDVTATAAISPDGSTVVVLGGPSIFILNATSGELLYTNDNFYTLLQPPTISLDSSLVICQTSSNFWAFPLTPPFYSMSFGYTAVGPITADSDLLQGNCLIYVLPENKVEKKCLGGSGGGSVLWQVQLKERSILAPIVGDNVVYVVTSNSGFIYAIDSASGKIICNSSDITLDASVTIEPVYLGGAYGIAFPMPETGEIFISQSGINACYKAAALPLPFGNAANVGPIVTDAQGIGYFTVTDDAVGSVPVIYAIDFTSTPSPILVWNYSMDDAVTPLISEPAIGADGSLVFTRVSSADRVSTEVIALYPQSDNCFPGEYSLLNGTCSVCPVGTYSGSTPSTSCTPCVAGESSPSNSSNSNACFACLPGFYSTGNGGSCLPCLAGTYNTISNASSCQLCPPGTFSTSINATSFKTCLACSPGSAQPVSGSSTCLPCISGTFSSVANAEKCLTALPACYTSLGSSTACGAILPYAMFGVDSTHGALSTFPGPIIAPAVSKISIFSGQNSLPVSGLAIGPSGGIISGSVYNGLIFLGLSDDIFAVSAINGAIVNNYNVPGNGSSFIGSPAVSSWGTVYFVSSFFSLIALPFDKDGDPLFVTVPALQSISSYYTITPPTVHSNNRAVYYTAASLGVLAIDGISGKQLWAWVPNSDSRSSLPFACSSPALDKKGRYVFIGCDDYSVYAINASSGLLIWSHLLSDCIRASPTVSIDDSLVFVSSDSNNLVALDTATGEMKWVPVAVSATAVRAAPAVLPNVGVVVGTLGGVVFLANNSVFGSSLVWSTTLNNGTSAPPVRAITLGSNGTIFVACEDGSLFALTGSTGTLLWRLALGEPLFSPPVLLDGGAGGSLLLPSLRSSAMYLVSATASPSTSPSSGATSGSLGTSGIIAISVVIPIVAVVAAFVANSRRVRIAFIDDGNSIIKSNSSTTSVKVNWEKNSKSTSLMIPIHRSSSN